MDWRSGDSRTFFEAMYRAAMPTDALVAHLPPPPHGRTIVLGAGKAAAAKAAAVDVAWPKEASLAG